MHLIIDASNINAGGAVTHLVEILRKANPPKYGFDTVELWSRENILKKIEDKCWLSKKTHPLLNKGYIGRFLWKYFVLKSKLETGDVLYIPGTGYLSCSNKIVTMCRNLLPIDKQELNRFFGSFNWFRLMLLRFLHFRAYQKADGVIFLNKYTQSALPQKVKDNIQSHTIIPHGLDWRFLNERTSYSLKKKFQLLNVSRITLYRHQWNLIEAVGQLLKAGYDIELSLVGRIKPNVGKRIYKTIERYKSDKDRIKLVGDVDYDTIEKYYRNADCFIYSSTCETFGMTVLEAMGNSLPIICSEKSSMSEMVQEAGIYFDPEDVEDTKKAILKAYNSETLREQKGSAAYQKAQNYSWEKTTDKTLRYLAEMYEKGKT